MIAMHHIHIGKRAVGYREGKRCVFGRTQIRQRIGHHRRAVDVLNRKRKRLGCRLTTLIRHLHNEVKHPDIVVQRDTTQCLDGCIKREPRRKRGAIGARNLVRQHIAVHHIGIREGSWRHHKTERHLFGRRLIRERTR